jgi:hypothetical protein
MAQARGIVVRDLTADGRGAADRPARARAGAVVGPGDRDAAAGCWSNWWAKSVKLHRDRRPLTWAAHRTPTPCESPAVSRHRLGWTIEGLERLFHGVRALEAAATGFGGNGGHGWSGVSARRAKGRPGRGRQRPGHRAAFTVALPPDPGRPGRAGHRLAAVLSSTCSRKGFSRGAGRKCRRVGGSSGDGARRPGGLYGAGEPFRASKTSGWRPAHASGIALAASRLRVSGARPTARGGGYSHMTPRARRTSRECRRSGLGARSPRGVRKTCTPVG